MKPKRDLKLIFTKFFLVGISSFGGYSALIAVVQQIFVEKLKVIKEKVIIEGFSLASLLPGPVAVNTVTYIGYNLASWRGALVSMIAVILPSMIFMLILSVVYEQVGVIPEVNSFLTGVIPVIMALILSVMWKMSKNTFSHWVTYIIFIVTLSMQFILTGYWVFIVSIAFGAVIGFIFFSPKKKAALRMRPPSIKWYHIILVIYLCLSLVLNFVELSGQSVLIQLYSVFSGVSLTLFGGGYVMIPMLEELVVTKYGWLTNSEFIDAIVLGQATPGPILISATFIGYKVAGLPGGIISTIAIFTPSALLITLITDLFSKGDHTFWQPIIKGIRPVVIALMTYSIWILANGFDDFYYPFISCIIAAFLLIRFQVHFLWLILASGIAGLVIF